MTDEVFVTSRGGSGAFEIQAVTVERRNKATGETRKLIRLVPVDEERHRRVVDALEEAQAG